MEKIEIKLKKASRRSAIISLLGVFVVIISLIYSYFQIKSLQIQTEEKRNELIILKGEVDNYEIEIQKYNEKISELSSTQESLLDFLAAVTEAENISILNISGDWKKVKNEIMGFKAGKRKDAILIAILLAWKDIPFSLGQESIKAGFDSPSFLRYVLSKVEVNINRKTGERLSTTFMNRFEKTDDPKPGDLVFFRGQIGSFGFILASIGNDEIAPVGVGTLQRIAPLQIISLDRINIRNFPLIGYFKVKYPDE